LDQLEHLNILAPSIDAAEEEPISHTLKLETWRIHPIVFLLSIL